MRDHISQPLLICSRVPECFAQVSKIRSDTISHSSLCSTTGTRFDTKGVHLTVPANSYHQFTLHGTAMEPGTLSVKGCVVEISGATREYQFSHMGEEEGQAQALRRGLVAAQLERPKFPGLAGHLQLMDSALFAIPKLPTTPNFVTVVVVQPQPLLRIRRTSLTHGSLMLYAGETYVQN